MILANFFILSQVRMQIWINFPTFSYPTHDLNLKGSSGVLVDGGCGRLSRKVPIRIE